MIGQFHGPVCYVNDVNHQDDIVAGRKSDTLLALECDRPQRYPVKLGASNNLLVVGYEDARLLAVKDARLDETIFGSSKEVLHVLLLRDPFNTFASRLQMKRSRPNNAFAKPFLLPDHEGKPFLPELWRRYANEFIGKTNHLVPKITINYNRWVVDEIYRRSISESIGGQFSDDLHQRVPAYGFGSSFDGRQRDGRSQEMDLFGRWKLFVDDDEYRRLFHNPEIVELSAQIFGEETVTWLKDPG
jgi:hypothetical protein